MTQCAPAHVRRKNFDFPGFREFQRFAERDRDRVRLFARRTARAPDAKRSRGLPKFSFLHLRENRLFERLVHARIAEKRSLLRQQPLEQPFSSRCSRTRVEKKRSREESNRIAERCSIKTRISSSSASVSVAFVTGCCFMPGTPQRCLRAAPGPRTIAA